MPLPQVSTEGANTESVWDGPGGVGRAMIGRQIGDQSQLSCSTFSTWRSAFRHAIPYAPSTRPSPVCSPACARSLLFQRHRPRRDFGARLVIQLTTPDICRAIEFAPPLAQINYLPHYRLSASNVEISSDAYAALWMKWDALGLQQRAAGAHPRRTA
jgi:hypothetical protein